jgi:hypothetical protein
MLDWMHLDEINLQCSSAKPDPGSDNHGNWTFLIRIGEKMFSKKHVSFCKKKFEKKF